MDRIDELEPARVTAVAGALLIAAVLVGFVVAAATGRWIPGDLVAAGAAAVLGLAALLYAWRLG